MTNLNRAGLLFASRTTGLGLGFLGTVVAARSLDPHAFGKFTFLRSVALFLAIFCDFGTSVATGRLLGLCQDYNEERKLCGAWLLIFLGIALGFSMVFATGSLWVGKVFSLNLGGIMLLGAVPALGVPLERALRELLQGCGATFSLGILNIVPWVLFLLGLISLGISGRISIEAVILLYFSAFLCTVLGLVVMLRPRFDGVGEFVRKILAETRSFGLKVYTGRVVGTGTFQLDSPMIVYFTHDAAAVGFYGLAKALVSPISLSVQSLSVAIYRDLIRAKRLAPKLAGVSLLWLLSLCLLYFLVARPVVLSMFALEYANVLPLLYVWILAALAQGAYQLPTFFLAAKGEGRVLRDMAIWFAVTNIALNFSLIPLLGAYGAALASAGANGFWLCMCVRSYYQRVALDDNALAQVRGM